MESNVIRFLHIVILVSIVLIDSLYTLPNYIKKLLNTNPPICASHVDWNKINYSMISLEKSNKNLW